MLKKRLLFLSCMMLTGISFAGITPTRLICEFLPNPDVVDVPHPRLGWVNIAESQERGQTQTAWQIRVASSAVLLDHPDLWNSGKVNSAKSNQIPYDGTALTSRQECWWQVRVWDRRGEVSDWSEPAFWRMGLLHENDWMAEWIGAPWQGEEAIPKPPGGPDQRTKILPPPAPLLRKPFALEKEVEKAVAFVTGLGYFELYLNGEKVGNDLLVPNQTNYGKRPDLPEAPIPLPDDFRKYKVMYLAYDVKDQLNSGPNVIGGILGNGFYNAPKYWSGSYGSPRFLCQLHITYTDGSEEVIKSDESWKASKSAIMMDLVYDGEHYDARKEQPGWCSPGFDDGEWQQVAMREAPYGQLVAHTAHTDKVTSQITPVDIEKIADGHYRVDFGVEISGRLRLVDVEGPSGHKVEITYISNIFSGDNSYIFNGDGPENYAARFNWFVFSAVEIHNWPGELKPEHLVAEAVNTYIEETATFETSNQLFNDINKIWKRSQLDNMHGGIASDCPHRERSGYTGDAQVACVTVMHNYDARSFYKKWIDDIREAQIEETGYVPNGAPWQPGCGGGVAWGAAICIMPWEFYLHYGDTLMLEDNYEAMKGYIRYMQQWVDDKGIMFSQAKGHGPEPLKWMNLGEWSAPGKTVPDHMVHTFYFWRCADLTSKVAGIMGSDEQAQHYRDLAKKTRDAFHDTYYDPDTGSYGKAGGNIFALRIGVPHDRYEKVIKALEQDIEDNDGHLDTGIFGTQFFFETLSDNGLYDLAFTAMNKTTEPSYGRWLALGATTTRESWDEGGSHNHPMFGGGLVWFYRILAGMQVDETQPGYRHMVFKPTITADIQEVTYENLTPFGRGGITWYWQNDQWKVDVTVPVGASATIHLPADSETISEGKVKAEDATGVTLRNGQDNQSVFELTSGKYQFTSALPNE